MKIIYKLFIALGLATVAPLSLAISNQNSFVFSNMEKVEYFQSSSVVHSDTGSHFLSDLMAYAEDASEKEQHIGAVNLGPLKPDAHLVFQNKTVLSFITGTPYGVVEHPIETRFSPSAITAMCSTTQEPNMYGICGLLSILPSIVKLGYLKQEDVVDSNGFFKSDLLKDMKNKTKDPKLCGLSQEDENDVYAAMSGGKVKCGKEIYIGGSSQTEELQKKLKTEDCSLTVYQAGEPGTGRSHIMFIESISSSTNPDTGVSSISFVTRDSGLQGDLRGNKVPSDPGKQTWTRDDKGNISVTAKSDFWKDWIAPQKPGDKPGRFFVRCCAD